jgi:hypothetical protein
MGGRTIPVIVALLLIGLCTQARAAGPIKIVKVALKCSTDDQLGRQLCYMLKEKIRASRGFELVSYKEAQQAPTGFGVYLTTIDATVGGSGYYCAMAVTYTMPLEGKPDSYINTSVATVGAKEVAGAATSLMADIEQESDFLSEGQ